MSLYSDSNKCLQQKMPIAHWVSFETLELLCPKGPKNLQYRLLFKQPNRIADFHRVVFDGLFHQSLVGSWTFIDTWHMQQQRNTHTNDTHTNDVSCDTALYELAKWEYRHPKHISKTCDKMIKSDVFALPLHPATWLEPSLLIDYDCHTMTEHATLLKPTWSNRPPSVKREIKIYIHA